MKIQFDATPKQIEALEILTSKTNPIRSLGFGGAAGGGKTYVACFWIWSMCMQYPGTKWFFARKTLKSLRMTSFASYMKMMVELKIPQQYHGHFNGQDHTISFANGSMIVLLDAGPVSSDPLYINLGGGEYTGGIIEESNELEWRGIDTLYSRIGRWKNDEYGIPPRILETFNPDKGHVYHRFYKRYKDGTLPEDTGFIPSLANDNPYISKDYIKNLENRDKITRERLLYGNFEYDDTPGRLYDYDSLINISKNSQTIGIKGITCDVARSGRDTSNIYIRDGRHIKQRITIEKNTTTELSKIIADIARQEGITMNDIMTDEVGVGGGVVDELGCLGFIGNASPYEKVDDNWELMIDDNYKNYKDNYASLFDQCCFEMAKYINTNKISNYEHDDMLIEELDAIVEEIREGKRKIISKDDRKKKLGRSPDKADCFVMRWALMYKQNTKKTKKFWSVVL